MTSSTLLLALGILSASFFGSWHCAAMCGPIASLMSARRSLLMYNLGRGCAYVLLGAFAGYLGQFFLQNDWRMFRYVGAGLLATVLILYGLSMLLPSGFKFPASHFILPVIKKIQGRFLSRSGFVIGLLTAFLPCGWLYTYVLAAVTTKSPWAGALVMGLFWLGGLPTLSAVPSMIRSTIDHAGLRHQKIAGGILVISGLYSIASFMFLH
ncbi:sulfite exporter TauE/SafE family protein [Bdellovibrio bacteriovorus]|uniref:sulfite exporter TauE/SafE family protein n=1 Tax=Bdellovibrio bacteriovorus TaxID=959 RepID=UPI0035A6F04F